MSGIYKTNIILVLFQIVGIIVLCSSCLPNPASVFFCDHEGRLPKSLERVINIAWLVGSLAFLVLGTLVISGTLQLGVTTGISLTTIGGLSILLLGAASCFSFCCRCITHLINKG